MNKEKENLFGNLIVVAGGLSGTGAAITEKLTQHGADVVAIRRTDRSDHTERFLEKVKDNPGKVFPVVADVAEKEGIYNVWDKLDDILLGVNPLVSGIVHAQAVGLQEGMSVDYVEEVNSLSPLKLTAGLAGYFEPGAKIVMLPSIWSYYYGEKEGPEVYNLVARTKHQGEEVMRKFLLSPELRVNNVLSLYFVVAGGIKGTAAWHRLRSAVPEEVKKVKNEGGETTLSQVAEKVVDIFYNNHPSGHVEFV